jgi:flavin reductase (DIM6/NTAB) family NADH-FMN oxidoreductase RutF
VTFRPLPLARVYRLLEPGPVVLLTTAHKGRANAMAMSWHTMMEFEPPLVGCGNTSGRNTDKFARFGLTPLPASRKRPRTIHHMGRGVFMVAGRTLRVPSRMK